MYKNMGECSTGGSVVSLISANVDVLPKVNVSEKKSYAVIMKSVDEKMTGERMKDYVFKYVKPDVKVRVRAVCKTKNGVVIDTTSERERQFLYDCKKYENVGLKVQMLRKIDPKIIMHDVPNEISEKVLLGEMCKRNLKKCISVEEFSERVRIISRDGKKGAVVGNVVIEMNRSACERLISEGRMYVE